MALFLVRHGRSLPEEIDSQRRLSREGITEVECVAAHVQDRGIRVDTIIHSPAARARQTAEIMASYLKPGHDAMEVAGLGPSNSVEAFAGSINENDDIMVVGHLPFLERLCSYLVTGSPDERVVSFRSGTMVCLEKDPARGAWVIRWTLRPDIC
ncbi:MAG TPA: phosphohistidine phosphatase SixA [Deltaproteobacteria bacterium]|nr:phosphohistidine phosphatase SixA [Deltaproteobacteria bacterium]HQQ16196.1 phosphohistidine phosphatase SixA [Deltaproteobacteria bacterium]